VCAYGNKLRLWDLRNNSNKLSPLTVHEGKVFCCIFSPDGTKIVSGSSDNTLKIWDFYTGKELDTLTGHEGSVLSCTFLPNSDRLISGSNDCLLKIWDIKGRKELCKYWAGFPIHSVSYSPSAKLIAAGDSTGTVHILQEIS
jgi:WD40 repeat protein